MGFHPDSRVLFAETLTMAMLATLAVGGRLYARKKVSSRYAADDYLVVAAAVFYWLYNLVVLDAAWNKRTGVDPTTLSYDDLTTVLKETYADIIFMSFCITLARFSVIGLYYRLFSVSLRFAVTLKIIGGLSVVWALIVILLATFRCSPIQYQWDPRIGGSCLNLQTIFVATESANCFLDVFLVCMPITLVRTLNLPLREKLALCGVFLVGGFVGVTSIVRIVFTYDPEDPAFAFTQSAFWTTIQLGCAIICACLPTYRALFPNLATQVKSAIATLVTRSKSTKRRSHGHPPPEIVHARRPSGWSHGTWPRSNNSSDLKLEHIVLTNVQAGEQYSVTREYPDGGIEVRNTLEIV